jgi:molybdate transport system ATP-binding protein
MDNELICRCRKRLASGFEVDADLRAPLAESPVTVLYGPSGAGKTTLLRLLAGLDQPDSGEILFRGRAWFDSSRGIRLTPQERRAGFLFQDYALFPHLTVERNVEYAAPRGAGAKFLEAFGIADLAHRYPRHISSGQQQRVALARALAAQPALLLLDEPLSALDGATRLRARRELRQALVDGGVPSILVTHDRMEAVTLGDWMAVILNGRIRQAGPAPEVFRRPVDAEVAECVGVENILAAEIVAREGGLLTLQVGAIRLQCLDSDAARPGPQVWACIRAEDVALSRDAAPHSSVRNRMDARVRSVSLEGPLARVDLDCGFPLAAAITARSAGELDLKPGDAVSAAVKATAVHLAPVAGPR